MKTVFSLTLFLLAGQMLCGQNDDCRAILHVAEKQCDEKKFESAQETLLSAETCDYKNLLWEARHALQRKIFKAIQEQKEDAEKKLQKTLDSLKSALAILLALAAAKLYFEAETAREAVFKEKEETEKAKAEAESMRNDAEKALKKFQEAEADKVWKDVQDILRRAERLRSRYPAQAKALERDAVRLLDDYRENDILQARRKTLNL